VCRRKSKLRNIASINKARLPVGGRVFWYAASFEGAVSASGSVVFGGVRCAVLSNARAKYLAKNCPILHAEKSWVAATIRFVVV